MDRWSSEKILLLTGFHIRNEMKKTQTKYEISFLTVIALYKSIAFLCETKEKRNNV